MSLKARLAAMTVLLLVGSGCAQYQGAPEMWYASSGATMPTKTRVVVCHAFGCRRRTSVVLTADDLARFRDILADGAQSPTAERAAIGRAVAWAETRVAGPVGSADDIGGLDLMNAGKAGQMDCIDEAANTTSYLLLAQKRGYLAHHQVARPVSRGFFLDGRYPHATAVITETSAGTAWAIDSWKHANGAEPDILLLDTWFAASPLPRRPAMGKTPT